MDTDTITAISTPVGEGAISIVRLSGPDAINITAKIFRGVNNLHNVKSHTMNYGNIIDPNTNDIAEEVLVSVMRAPKTYTKEDIVEINCHGGMVAVNRVLEIVLSEGARLAEPGEFTKRAFLNGRIDLSQAEAVMDLIRAKTDEAMSVALKQMDGRLSKHIKKLRQELLEAIAHVEVNIDYPEYDDVEEMSHDMMQTKTKEVHADIERLLSIARQGKILREGVKTGIIGRPNVGKSSLMNALVQENKAIVTEVPGTTRDIIEEYVNVRGVPLQLIDTAGIRETEDVVERIGVERSQQVLTEADLILFVLNNNEPLTDDDLQLFEAIKELQFIVIINKSDLKQRLNMDQVKQLAQNQPIVNMSLVNDEGIEQLEEQIAQTFFTSDLDASDAAYISNIRHIQLLKRAKKSLEDAMDSLKAGMPLDIVQIDVTQAWEFLGEIVGDTASEALIDQLFSQFCLGK